MQRKQYEQCMEWLEKHIGRKKVFLWIRANTLLFVGCYLFVLAYLAMHRDVMFWKALYVPAVGYIVLSVFRCVCNASRPYEIYEFTPLVKKDTKGKSFPSRHVFSAVIIAMTVCQFSLLWGILLFVPAIILAVLRVMTGIHFPRDVIAGVCMGIVAGVVGYLWI